MALPGIGNIQSSYFFVYLDIIELSINGSSISKVIYLTKRAFINEQKNVNISLIKYFKLEKRYITDITVLIAGSDGKQIQFESSWIPTCVQLHFRKKK